MKELLKHLNELDAHIKYLNHDIKNHMKPGEKRATGAIKNVTSLGVKNAQAIISVIGTDMGRFPMDGHISSLAGLCPGDNESAKKRRS